MITFADSFIGSNTALVGTPIESCSVACDNWASLSSNLFRNATGLQANVGSYAASANILTPVTSVPLRLVVEADLYTLDSGSDNQANSASLVVGGTRLGDPISIFARISTFRSPTSFNAAYTLSVPDAGEYDLYLDTTPFTGDYVKRKFDVDIANKTYACYAEDILIASGTFADDLILDTIDSTGVTVFIQRQGGSATASRVRNLYAELYPGTPAAPATKFWTGHVNTFEVV